MKYSMHLEKVKNMVKSFFAKKENIYLALALFFGLSMAVFNPPFAGVPDEHAHYWKSWAIAEGNMVCKDGNMIPATAMTLPNDISPMDIPGVKDKKIVVSNLKNFFFAKYNSQNVVGGGAICGTSPWGYFPQAIGLDLGRILHLSALASFYFARIVNLLAAIAIVYWAIKIVPFGKIIFMLIALLPMTMQQFASVSYDALSVSLLFLFIAYVLRLTVEKEKKLTTKEFVTLLVLSLLGLNAKVGYGVASLLVLVLPVKKFKSEKKYWLFVIAFLAANAAFIFLLRAIFSDGGSGIIGDKIDPAKQLSFVLANPFAFLLVIFETIYSRAAFFFETFFFKPGWLKTGMPHLWYIFMVVGYYFILSNNSEIIPLSKKQRFWTLLTFLTALSVTFLSLYLVWTKVGADEVSGLQGRYFLGIAPLLIVAFYKKNPKEEKEKNAFQKNFFVIFCIFYLVAYFFVFQKIYTYYYEKIVTKSVTKVENNVIITE